MAAAPPKIHDPTVVAALAEDINAHAPDHVALTGDLVNIALPGEFHNAAAWLKGFGNADWVTLVPGNHDAYVGVGWGERPWSLGRIHDRRNADAGAPASRIITRRSFPFVSPAGATSP